MSKKYKFELRDMEDSFQLHELNEGIVRVDDDICDYMYTDIDRQIKYILDQKKKHITIKINSGGGGAYSALAIYDIINGLKRKGIKTTAIVEGLAASAASMIVLQAADNRYSMPTARFLIHEPRRWGRPGIERTSDMKDETQEMSALSNIIYEILSKRCKKTFKEIEKSIDRREYWMSASQALEYKLIDAILK